MIGTRHIAGLATACLAAALLLCLPTAAVAEEQSVLFGVEDSGGQVALSAQDDDQRDAVTMACFYGAKLSFDAGDEPVFTGFARTGAVYVTDNLGGSGFEFWAGSDGTLVASTEGAPAPGGTFESFQEGVSYSYGVVLQIRGDNLDKYKFTEDTKLMLNGDTFTCMPVESGGSLYREQPSVMVSPDGTFIVFMGMVSFPKTWERLWGGIGYETMVSICEEGWRGSTQTAFLATYNGYQDALVAAPGAGMMDAPVLLTSKTALPAETKAQIERLGVNQVVIMGGEAAIASNVEAELRAMGCSTYRVAGENAQLTAVQNAEELTHGPTSDGMCIVATSRSYHDALAIAPFAYAHHTPIYLTNRKGALCPEAVASIERIGYTDIVIVGGTAVVPDSTKAQLEGIVGNGHVTRLWGQNALETSNNIAEWCVAKQGMSPNGMGVATAGGYYDALVGAALCGKNNSVLVLVNKAGDNLYCIDNFVADHADEINHGYVFGGSAAVPHSVVTALEAVAP